MGVSILRKADGEMEELLARVILNGAALRWSESPENQIGRPLLFIQRRSRLRRPVVAGTTDRVAGKH